MKTCISLLSALFLSIGLYAQIVLERDINTEAASSNPQDVINYQGFLYFQANDGILGDEMWQYDLSTGEASIAVDLDEGEDSSNPVNFFGFDGRIFFSARIGSSARRLYVYDPSDGSAQQVFNSNNDIVKDPFAFLEFEGQLYFRGEFSDLGNELVRFNPTTNLVELVADINPGETDSNPNSLVEYDGKLWFSATGGLDSRLYYYDPTTAEVSNVAYSSPSGIFPSIGFLYEYQDLFYFQGFDQSTGSDLFIYDPATNSLLENTEMIPGLSSSNPNWFTGFEDKVYFSARTNTDGGELRVYDPATGIVSLVEDLNPNGNTNPSGLTLKDGIIYFTGNPGIPANQLYAFNPGANVITNLGGVDNGDAPNYMTIGTIEGNTIYLPANLLDYGYELFKHELGSSTFDLAADINLKTIGSRPYGFTDFDGKLYFGADEINFGNEVWVYNPASGEVDILTGAPGNSSPTNFVATNGKLYFTGIDTSVGYGIKFYDPVTETINATSYFTPNSSGGIDGMIEYNGRLYFSNFIDTFSRELIYYDPLTDEYDLVQDLNIGGDARPEDYFVFENELYFAANRDDVGRELFKYNSTTNEITLAADINPGEEDSNPDWYLSFNGELYFSAYTDDFSYQIYSYNPTTQTITQHTSSTSNLDPRYLVVYKDKLHFSGRFSSAIGYEICYLDPQTGELMVGYDVPSESSAPRDLVVFNDQIFYSATTNEYGRELWSYNDTIASIFADIRTGPLDSDPTELALFNGKLYLSADDGELGEELYSVAECLNIIIDTEPAFDSLGVGMIDLTVTGGELPYTFNWSNGASTEDISSLEVGSFTVTVTDASGCVAQVTAEVPFAVDVEELLEPNLISVFPNPSNGQFNIESNGLIQHGVTIYDLQGRVVYLRQQLGATNTLVRLNHFIPGMYVLKVETEDGVIIRKVMFY